MRYKEVCAHFYTYIDREKVPNTNKIICREVCAECYTVLRTWYEYK